VVIGQYQYDALGRRVEKISNPMGSSPTSTLYFYDDTRIVEEENLGFATQATYIYGNYIDEILTMDRGGSTYYYYQNALWSVAAVTDSAGNPVERYIYDAYGSVTSTGGTNSWGTPHSAIGNPWLFTGRQFEGETGLYYYRARYYDPAKGRFLERDPLESGVNLYSYVDDQPTAAVDPDGLLLIAVDGTGSRAFLTPSPGQGWNDRGPTLSHVRNFFNDYQGKKRYWNGPDSNGQQAAGRESATIHAQILAYLDNEWCTDQSEPIDMVGHSRGGDIVLQVAIRLNEGIFCGCEFVKPTIRFLGLYDPVDMTTGYTGRQPDYRIPGNVENSAVVLADPGLGSRSSWGRAYRGPRSGALRIWGTHAALGGAPNTANWPNGLDARHTWEADQDAARTADIYMRTKARDAGVPIRVKARSEYNYFTPEPRSPALSPGSN
jgi:RHS repeat-associated protein